MAERELDWAVGDQEACREGKIFLFLCARERGTEGSGCVIDAKKQVQDLIYLK